MRYHIRNFIVYAGIGILLFTGLGAEAQTLLKHNWYFGNTQRAIRFNRVTNAPSLLTNKAIPFGLGGSAVATDRLNGNVLFYTDGQRVYDANNVPMPNGNGVIPNMLTANISANQPVAICAVPGNANKGKFFVFTNTASFTTGGAISFSIVDMKLFGASSFPAPAFGDVERKNIAIPGLVNVAEGMITVPHANGEDFWLITQTVNSTTFNATLINAASYTGTAAPGIFTTETSTPTAIPTTVAHFAYHEELEKVAVAPQDRSTDAIILGFNPDTGEFSPDRIIPNSGVLSLTNEAIYDIEWSPSGRYLYLSRHGETGTPGIPANVFQYDYDNTAITLAPVLPAPVFRSYGLQRAPDSTIYHLYQSVSAGPFLLGRIENPDAVAADAEYNPAPAIFAGLNFDGKQFSGFVPKDTIKISVDFTFAGTCENSPTMFFPNVRPGADSLVWDFGDGNFGRGWGPIYTYEEAGTYNVSLTAYYQEQSESKANPVTIRAFPLTLTLVQDTTACRSEFPPPRGTRTPTEFSVPVKVEGGTPASIVWSNGDLGPNLTPDSAGYYYVIVTDAAGCSAYAGVNVKEYGLTSQQFNKWYFGNKAGIDFTIQPPKALNESVMVAPEGVAIACDRNGQQLFYTDGSTVWGKNHTVLATGIGGSPASTQSVLVMPIAGDETLFYIFTTQAINGSDLLQLKYSVFDLKGNGGTGAIVEDNVFLFLKSSERVTANGQWLIVHELGNSTFRAYPISGDGIGNQVYTDIGSINSLAIKENGEGYMKLGPPPGNLVAVPLSTPGISNKIDLSQLDLATGKTSKYQSVDLNEPNGHLYGLEFSGSGRKLYASVIYSPNSSAIYEYSIDTVTFVATFRQRIPVAAEVGAIQIGPDGTIYVAINNAANNTSLGIINPNDELDENSSFILGGFALASGTNSLLGLPNFIQTNSQGPGGPAIGIVGFCSSDSTHFTAERRVEIDVVDWKIFRAGALFASSSEVEFALLLPPGDYTANMTLTNRCDATPLIITRNFTITGAPANPGRGVPLCNTPTVTLDANPANVPGLTYQWNRGQTTETINVSEQGIFRVTVTDAVGCSTVGTFLTADSRPIFDLGPDLTICQNQNTPALNVLNPGMTYQWTIEGVNASTTAVQAIDTDFPGEYTYAVHVADPVTGCFRDDDKTYTINVSPDFDVIPTNPTTCLTATGAVQLDINTTTPNGGPYAWFMQGPGGSDDGVDADAGDSFTLPNVGAGTYSVVVQDQVSQCTISKTIGLSDAGFNAVGVMNTPACDPPGVVVQVTLAPNVVSPAPPVFAVTWTATNPASTDPPLTGTFGGPALTFPTLPLVEGTYTIEVRDAGGCIATFQQDIVPGPRPTLVITPEICDLKLTASALTPSGGNPTSFVWTANPPTALTGPINNVPEVTLVSNSGTVTFTVTGTDPAFACPGTETVTLNIGNIMKPTLDQTEECATTATLTATPDGTFNYQWKSAPAGSTTLTYDPTLGGRTLTLTEADNGKSYQVTIFEPQSGCTLESDAFVAEVQGLVDVNLTSTPPCKDEKPFILTAVTQATGSPTFSWSRNGTTISSATTGTLTSGDEGSYTVVVSKGDCRASNTLAITRADLPKGNLPSFAVICDDPENDDPSTSTFALDPGVFVSYEWSKFGVLLNDNNRVFVADSKGEYSVKITDANQCTNIDETDVRNDCVPFIFTPTVFRPASAFAQRDVAHADLKNSEFWAITKFVEEEKFHVFIFNRWGEMVFTSSDRFFKWNGGMGNDISRPLPPGTYAFVIQYTSVFRPDEGVKEKRGGVALVR